jgi:phosphatidylglycerophosphatase A
MCITMLAAPPAWSWRWALAGFALFRIFDIVKPWPIREIDHGMRGGVGIMLDDVLAGILAASILLLIRYIT